MWCVWYVLEHAHPLNVDIINFYIKIFVVCLSVCP